MLREYKRCDCLRDAKQSHANRWLKGLIACQPSVSRWWPQYTAGCSETMRNSHTDIRQKAVEIRLTQPDVETTICVLVKSVNNICWLMRLMAKMM